MATTTITEQQTEMLPTPGQPVRVTRPDGYLVLGRFIGLQRTPSGTTLRVLPEDRIERRVPLPATVSHV